MHVDLDMEQGHTRVWGSKSGGK